MNDTLTGPNGIQVLILRNNGIKVVFGQLTVTDTDYQYIIKEGDILKLLNIETGNIASYDEIYNFLKRKGFK